MCHSVYIKSWLRKERHLSKKFHIVLSINVQQYEIPFQNSKLLNRSTSTFDSHPSLWVCRLRNERCAHVFEVYIYQSDIILSLFMQISHIRLKKRIFFITKSLPLSSPISWLILLFDCAMDKVLRVVSFILLSIRSFLSIWIDFGFRIIYGNQKFKLPPITNQILLQPAIIIAKRIRLRQVISLFDSRIIISLRIRSHLMKLFKLILIVFDRFNRISIVLLMKDLNKH